MLLLYNVSCELLLYSVWYVVVVQRELPLVAVQRELREEERRYREYLRAMKAESAHREAELERLIDAEVERSWEKRLTQWKQEKIARQKLLEDVMTSRRRQIQEKCTCLSILTLLTLSYAHCNMHAVMWIKFHTNK